MPQKKKKQPQPWEVMLEQLSKKKEITPSCSRCQRKECYLIENLCEICYNKIAKICDNCDCKALVVFNDAGMSANKGVCENCASILIDQMD